MNRHRACAVALAAVISLLALPATAAAKTLTVSGKLDRAGYGVVAVGYNGKIALTRKQAFSLKVPDGHYTLQLLTAKGKYGGPVIVGYKGKAALEGLTTSVKLGTIKVVVGAGYAAPVKSVPKQDLDLKRLVNTKGKAPIGNGRNFGFVSSRGNGGSGAGLDSDQDGVPNVFDVAKDGHTILNAFAGSGGVKHGVRARAAGGGPPTFNWMSQIFLPLDETLNADASGVTKAQIDAMLVQELNVKGLNLPTADLIELDCGGLTYCKAGTSAEVVTGNNPDGTPQTAPLSVDSAGFPVLVGPGAPALLTNPGNPGNAAEFSLMPRATSDQIQTGDTPILRTTSGGVLTQTPVPIDFVFDTVPALASYDDLAGDAGTISYPAPAGEPGTQSNPIPVAANSTGDVVVALKFWRPQRAGITGAGEPAFMDIGHLQYTVDAVSLAQAAAGPGSHPNVSSCSSASLTPGDPSLSVSDGGPGGGFLVDSADDAPANPANQLAFNIDLTKCMTDGGAPGFPVGTQGALGLKANAPGSSDHAVQNVWVKRVR
jgi:hypothetical protein